MSNAARPSLHPLLTYYGAGPPRGLSPWVALLPALSPHCPPLQPLNLRGLVPSLALLGP